MKETNGKKTSQAEETARRPLFDLVVGLALLLLAVVLLIRGINCLKLNGCTFGVIISFVGTLLFAAVSALMMSDLLQGLKAKSGKK